MAYEPPPIRGGKRRRIPKGEKPSQPGFWTARGKGQSTPDTIQRATKPKNPASAAAAVKSAARKKRITRRKEPDVSTKKTATPKPVQQGSMGQTQTGSTTKITTPYTPGGPGAGGPTIVKPAAAPKDVKQGGSVQGTAIPGLLTDTQLRKQAMKLLDPIFAAQRTALQGAYDTKAASVQNAYAALAEIAKTIAPQVQGAYQQGADAVASYGKGYSSAAGKMSAAEADAANQSLRDTGSPQQVESLLKGGGEDALYAAGGAIPATALATSGAAFTSAAANLPFTAGKLGVEETQRIGNQFLEAVKELEAGRPQALIEVITNLRENNWKQIAFRENQRIADAELGVAGAKAQAALTAEQRKAQQQAFDNQLDWAKVFGFDPTTGLRTQKSINDANKLIAQAKKNEKKAKGISPNTYATKKAQAGKAADLFYYGDEKKQIPGIDYQTALRRLMSQYSMRLVDAQAILNTYYEPGERLRPFLSFQQRAALLRAGVPPAVVDKAMWDGNAAAQILRQLGG